MSNFIYSNQVILVNITQDVNTFPQPNVGRFSGIAAGNYSMKITRSGNFLSKNLQLGLDDKVVYNGLNNNITAFIKNHTRLSISGWLSPSMKGTEVIKISLRSITGGLVRSIRIYIQAHRPKAWYKFDISANTNAPDAAGNPAGYVLGLDNSQHIVFRGTNGHIYELYWKPSSGWHKADLTAKTNAPDAAGDPAGYVLGLDNTQHIVFRGTNGHIYELYWKPSSGWHKFDISANTNAPDAAGDPTGYVLGLDNSQHVVFRGTNGHIYELYWNPSSGWYKVDLTTKTNAPDAAGDPTGYVLGLNTQHIVFRGTNGHIYELYWNPSSGWYKVDLTTKTNAPDAAGDPTGYVLGLDNSQHIVFRGTNGHIYELYWSDIYLG